MKLFSFTTVKDEADIIESFVRYNLNILDGMVISDNCSNDNTYDILLKLKEEGLNIYLLKDEDAYFDQTEKRQYLMDYTFKEFNPDIVFPLDADEFIAAYDNVNPRKIIETLDLNQLHKYRFENYVISKSDNEKELFIPKRMKTRRILVNNNSYVLKTIIPKAIYDKGVILLMGAHNLEKNNNHELISSVLNNELFLAHFPVRSNIQIINKVIVGRLSNSSLHDRKENLGFHQYDVLDYYLKNGKIDSSEIIDISKRYGIKTEDKIKRCIHSPLSVEFCKNIKLKYTKNVNNELLLANTVKLSETIINRMRTKINKLEEDSKELMNEIELLKRDNNQLNMYIASIENSKSWKITKPLRNLKSIVKK
ncbi:MAG: glycosyltransferase family 2 protein [Bacilli bacterium]|nr:glycosyltransferase family 2 protein [Bacilli bacterium]